MNEVKPYIGIISTIVILSTLINVFFISPKKANADNTFSIQKGSCLSLPYVANGIPSGVALSDGTFSDTSSFSFVGDGLLNVGVWFETENAGSKCKDGDVATGIGLTRVFGKFSQADGISIVLICCTPVAFSLS